MIRIHVSGDYGHRQPLAYAPLHALVAGDVVLEEDAARADLILITHPKDLANHGAALRATLGHGQRLVMLSEEPFWDTIWGHDPFHRDQVHDTGAGPLPYTWLNHLTSPLFAFDRIPYFLLTDPSYAVRYAALYRRNSALGAADWKTHFQQTRALTFMAERRRNEKFDRRFEGRDVFGLSALRTRIAQALSGHSPYVVHRGSGWEGPIRRQDLGDWHGVKLQELDMNTKVLSGIENTHLDSYITEKLFDAFAVGAWPLYIAGPGHRVHGMVPGGSWLNLYGLEAEGAATAIAGLVPDAERYAEAQATLAALFAPDIVAAEKDRLRTALLAELAALR